MTPNIPSNALAVFGPEPSADGQWGGVPWMHGVLHPEALEGMWHGSVTTFPYAQANAVMFTSDADCDTDGPGTPGGAKAAKRIDPWWEPDTSLRDVHNVSCDSRVFPGVVISPALKALGVQVGDFCLVSWRGVIRSAQVYDIGPLRKIGELALFLIRALGLAAGQSDHQAATNGNDATDVVTLIFAGSGPGHAVSVDVIIAETHRLWAAFTSRPAAAPITGPGKPLVQPRSGVAAGSVGLAAPLGMALLTVAFSGRRLLGSAPPPEFSGWLACVSFALTLWLLILHIRKEMRPDPPLEKRFASVERVDGVDEALANHTQETSEKIEKLEAQLESRHTENVAHLRTIEAKLERNFEATQTRQDKLLTDVRHEVRGELMAAEIKAEARFEKQIDRFTDVVRGLGRVEGGRPA